MSFQINDKVVCVDNSRLHWGNADRPQIGTVYVVRGVITDGPRVGLHLVGLNAGTWRRTRFGFVIESGERGYDARRFRKLSDIKAENAAKRKQEARI